jgi:hypothetical protein
MAAGSVAAYGDDVGTLYYGGAAEAIRIEDRALAHVKVVIATKLRRNESFTLSWAHPDDQPRGRSTIWLHPSIPLRFVFDDPEPAQLNRQWIEELAGSANSTSGILLAATMIDDEAGGEVVDESGQQSSVGTVDVEELVIGKLTVAGRDVVPQEILDQHEKS